jgi:hypothetical protein
LLYNPQDLEEHKIKHSGNMPNLDDKLKEILQANSGYGSMSDEYVIAQIKQAFADEGYKKPGTAAELINKMAKDLEDAGVMRNWSDTDLLTGQEWYWKFVKESERVWDNRKSKTTQYNEMVEAAKKASGIE